MSPAEDQTLEALLDAYHAGQDGAASRLFDWCEAYFRAVVRPSLARQFGGVMNSDTSARYTRIVNDFFVKSLEGREDAVWRQRSAEALRAMVTRALANDVRDILRRRRGIHAEQHELEVMAEERRVYFEDRFDGLEFERVLQELESWFDSGDAERQRMARILHQRYLVGDDYGAIAAAEGLEDRRALYRLRDSGLALLGSKLESSR